MNEPAPDAGSLDRRAILAANDRQEAERLIEEFRPFLHGCARRYATADPGSHDELFSQAMTAFYEAVKSFDAARGHFFPFAERVVRLRMIDQVRKTYSSRQGTVSIEEDDDGAPQSEAINRVSTERHRAAQHRAALAEEVGQFCTELLEWNITLEGLSRQSPRHDRLRRLYRQVVEAVARDVGVMQVIMLKRYFPIKKSPKQVCERVCGCGRGLCVRCVPRGRPLRRPPGHPDHRRAWLCRVHLRPGAGRGRLHRPRAGARRLCAGGRPCVHR